MGRPATDLRERLLDAALAHFARTSVDAASMRAIARDAGTSVGMITYHFGSKDGLFFALVDRFYEPFRAELDGIARAHEEPLERLEALLRRMGALTDVERASGRVLVRELSIQSDRVLELRERFLRGHVRTIVDTMHQCVAAGQVREVSIFATLPVLLAPFVMPQVLRLGELIGIDDREHVEATLDVLRHGLLGDRSS